MADVNFEEMMRTEVETILRTLDAEASCFIYTLPPDLEDAPMVGVVFPSSGIVGTDGSKTITLQVRVRSRDEASGKQGIEAVYEALKDCAFEPGINNQFRVICTATSTPSFMGLDDAGQPVFGCLFELVSVY